MTELLANPFDFGFADVVMPSAEKAGASSTPQPSGAPAARFDRYFDPDKFLRDIAIGLPFMSAKAFSELTGEDLPPLFLSDPSDEFIAGFHRDVLPMLEDLARRAG